MVSVFMALTFPTRVLLQMTDPKIFKIIFSELHIFIDILDSARKSIQIKTKKLNLDSFFSEMALYTCYKLFITSNFFIPKMWAVCNDLKGLDHLNAILFTRCMIN